MNENAVIIQVNLDTKNFDRQINQVEGRLEEIDTMLSKPKEFGLTEDEMAKLNIEAEKLNNKLIQLNNQQDKINKQGLKDFEKQMGGLGSGIEKATKKIAKMALAVFGIRSAFMFVRNSINAITQQDEQLKANIDYMKNAIAYTIEPIVRRIVDWAYQILQYVRYIIKSWFNYDIFENANKNLKATNKSAKELKRTLASFDEVNVLSSNSGTGTTTPSIDLQKDIQPPKWVKWIADNKKLIETFGIAIGAVFAYSKIKSILSNIGMLFGASGGVGLVGLAEILAIIGTAYIATIAVKGVAEAVRKAKEVEEAWNNTKNAIEGVNKKQDELVKNIIEDFDNLPQEKVDEFFGFLDSEIQLSKNQVKALSDEKDNLWWSPSKQKEIQDKIDEYQQKIKNLTNTKYQLQLKVGIDDTELQKFLIASSKAGAISYTPSTDASSFYILGKKYTVKNHAQGGISYPKLAKGGIVNMPGRGIMYNGGNIAERGAEGILPLTDSQQMELLGATIGKYITVNATIPVYAYNRQVDRQFRKIQGQDNFAGNR